MSRSPLRLLVAEAVGTFALVFAGAADAAPPSHPDQDGRLEEPIVKEEFV